MNVEWFIKLKEYDSLMKMRQAHLKAIKEQEDRLIKLNQKRNEGTDKLESHKKAQRELNQELFETEKKLKTSEEQKQRLVDLGGDETKIQLFRAESQKLEEAGLHLLEKLESNESEMKEAQEFLAGLEATYKEIETEVREEKSKEETAVKQLDFRLAAIQEELPDDFRSLLLKTLAKNLAVGPFTRIEAGSCYFCRFKISRLEESEIDMQKMLKVCPQCSRIFLPYGA